jgi:hypothetical protein
VRSGYRGDLDCFPFGYASEPALSLSKGPVLPALSRVEGSLSKDRNDKKTHS